MATKKKPKTSAKKRPAKKKTVTATRRSTAGTGFDFEDGVAAWLLLQALAGRGLPLEGSVQRLQMQTSSLHWDIDDLLLTTSEAGSAPRDLLQRQCAGFGEWLAEVVRRAGMAALDQGR